MYTHLHPELDDVPTAKSVLRDGRIAMYRALNIGRLVVVTGSGSTMTLGQPAWGEIPHLYSLSVQQQIDESFLNHPSLNPVQFKKGKKDPEYRRLMFTYRSDLRAKIDGILRQIHSLCNDEGEVQHKSVDGRNDYQVPLLKIPAGRKVDTLTLLSLCDALLKRLPDDRETGETRLFRARHHFASRFADSETEVIASKILRGSGASIDLNEVLEVVEDHKPELLTKGLMGLGSYLSVLKWLYFGRERNTDAKVWRSTPLKKLIDRLVSHHDGFGPRLERDKRKEKESGHDGPSRDIVATLLNDLRISRIATLNFDVEIERRILRDLRLTGETEATDFEDLCEQTRTVRPHKKRLLIESGVKKGAVSITLTSDNIGEIVNFSSYSRRFEKQVLHLHGRFDDPENLVLTPDDYLRTYAQREVSRESFREAQQTLFEGNDVLFVGIGFTEDEVRRPLAQFFASEAYVRHDTRRAFLLKAASSCSECFKAGGDCRKCKRKDEEFILNEYQKLNVYTILYGGDCYRATISWLDSALKDVENAGKDRKESAPEPVEFWKGGLHEDLWSQDKVRTRRDQLGHEKNWGPLARAAMLEEAREQSARLLTETELKLLVSLSNKQPAESQLPVLKMILEELKSRVMARAANLELRLLNEESGRWWDAWGEIPVERRALYHMAADNISGRNGYLWARHCPVATGNGEPKKWSPLDDAVKQAAVQLEGQAYRKVSLPEGGEEKLPVERRILRFSGPRGVGKGTLIRMLMNHKNQTRLFRRQTGYAGAFVAHLSFSMEFASVAKALTRFFSRHAAELQAKHEVDGAKNGLENTREELKFFCKPNSFCGATRLKFASLMQEFTPKETLSLGETLERFQAYVTKECVNNTAVPGKIAEHELRDLAFHLYIARREAEPRLVENPDLASIAKLEPMVEREHRLDMLAKMMRKYMNLARDYEGGRLFVCLGGLDRLCDRFGDAHNPMHRAMFRILTGTFGYEDVSPPMDLVLIAGRPQTPICFLSETIDKVNKVPLHDRKLYATYSQTGQALEVWPKLERPSWADRLNLVPAFTGGFGGDVSNRERQLKRDFLNWAEPHDAVSLHPRQHDYSRTDGIHRTLWHSVGLTILVYCCWREIRLGKTDMRSDLEFTKFVRELERHENRDGATGIMNYVFGAYGLLNRSVADPDNKLDDLILRHLVLFGLPVEPLVLLACPMISRRLLRRHANGKEMIFGEGALVAGGDPRQPNHDGDIDAWELRGWMLKDLRDALGRLCRRGLVLEVHCAFPETEAPKRRKEEQSPQLEGAKAWEAQKFLHRRFGMHGQIREMVGHRMQLDVSDEGDLNHHQISLFCSQPQDLPTPSEAHFRMLKEILDKLQEDNRDSLRIAYRHSQAGVKHRRHGWDKENHEPRDGYESHLAVQHLFAPHLPARNASDDVLERAALAGSLGQIHAIPQRLRAGFSLVRSAFSVGSLSRMENVRPDREHEPPFEVYRGWLRGLMNAATGLRINHSELTWLLSDTVIARDAGEYKADKQLIKGLVNKSLEFPGKAHGQASGKSDFEKALDLLGMAFNKEKLEEGDPADIQDLKDGAANIARIVQIASQGGNKFTRRQRTIHKTLRHPLYRDEIAWLFNERALTSLIQGRIYDAIPLFRKARFIMSHRLTPSSDNKAYNAVERRINLNLAIAQIERGNIAIARSLLADNARSSESLPKSTPSRLTDYIVGYKALCEHLGGSFEAARAGYKKSLKKFEKRRELRAIGIFKRHFGDLHLANGDLDEAERDLKLAMNASSQAQQRDIWNMAQASYARLLIEKGKLQEAESYIRQVRAYAENMGLYGLRAQALQTQAVLLIARGELGPAAGCAANAIALSSRYGMRLRKLSSLIIYGEIQLGRGQKEVGIHVLRNARTEAEKLGYQLKAAQAAEILSRQDKSPRSHHVETRI